MNDLKVGVIGYGYWGPKMVRNFVSILHGGMYGVADKKPERLDAATAQYPHLRTYLDAERLIDVVDIVVITTPVSTHYGVAKRALEAGKHVLIAKPMTDTVKSSEELILLAEKQGVTLMVDHTFIFTGAVQKMRELVDRNELGKLYYFDSVRVNLGLFHHDTNVLWDLAPHDISIMDYLLQEQPISVAAHGACHINYSHVPIEDIAYLTMFFENNLIAHVHVNWLAPVKVRKTLLAGSEKMVVYDDTEPDEKIKVYDKGVEISPKNHTEKVYDVLVSYRTGDMYAPKLDKTEPLRKEIIHFLDCVQTGRMPISDGYSGLNVVRILEAAQYSIDHGGIQVELCSETMAVSHSADSAYVPVKRSRIFSPEFIREGI